MLPLQEKSTSRQIKTLARSQSDIREVEFYWIIEKFSHTKSQTAKNWPRFEVSTPLLFNDCGLLYVEKQIRTNAENKNKTI